MSKFWGAGKLVAQLDHHVTREDAKRQLIALGKAAVPDLLDGLRDRNASGVSGIESAAILGLIGDPDSLPPLIQFLRDSDEKTREYAAFAIDCLAYGGVRDSHAVEPLLELLKEPSWLTRSRSALALGSIGDGRALQPLLRVACEDPDSAVQKGAIAAIAKLGDPRGIELLQEVMRTHRLAYLRKEIEAAVTKLAAPAVRVADTSRVQHNKERSDLATNLKRWCASGFPAHWVDRKGGVWNHEEWLALLIELKTSPFWPMDESAIGRVLEDLKATRMRRLLDWCRGYSDERKQKHLPYFHPETLRDILDALQRAPMSPTAPEIVYVGRVPQSGLKKDEEGDSLDIIDRLSLRISQNEDASSDTTIEISDTGVTVVARSVRCILVRLMGGRLAIYS